MFFQGSQRPWRGLPGVLSIAEVSASSPPSSLIALLKLLHLVVPVAGARVIPLKNWASLGDRLTQKIRFRDNRQTAWVKDWRGCSRVPGTLSVPHWCFSPHSDAESPFIEMHSDIPKLVNMSEGQELIIPCRVTSPNITVTLKKVKLQRCSRHSLASNGCRFTHKEDIYNQAQ